MTVSSLSDLKLEKYDRLGEEALGKLRARPYDVLITDFQMPRMDGQELCEALHANGPIPKPLTLVVTGKTDVTLRAWAEQLPSTEFLEKPLSLRHLTARLESYFDGTPVAVEDDRDRLISERP